MGQVSLRGVRKHFGTTEVIRGIDLEVADGEFLVFVGPSGCGKSTTLRMIAGLETISEGELLIDGQRANELHPAQRGAAMVFQSYALYPHMTVAENMGFALRMAGVSRTERQARVREAAERLRITELLERLPRDLSGGQRQRVAIGRAIVRQPRVFLFDEPLSNLDASLRVDMRIELRRLHEAIGATMIYVTHDQVEAMTLGQRIAVFHAGRLEQVGAPMALYERPANAFVAGFLGTPRINLVPRPGPGAPPPHQALWDALLGAQGPLAPRTLAVQQVGLRPEHLRLRHDDTTLAATVVLAEHLGDATVVHLSVPGLPELLRAKVDDRSARLAAGTCVGLAPDPAAALAFDAEGRLIA